MHSMNQAKTSAGVVTSQTSNETPLFSEEVENNVSDSTLSVKRELNCLKKVRSKHLLLRRNI